MDVLVSRHDNIFKRSVYRKPTCTGLCIYQVGLVLSDWREDQFNQVSDISSLENLLVEHPSRGTGPFEGALHPQWLP